MCAQNGENYFRPIRGATKEATRGSRCEPAKTKGTRLFRYDQPTRDARPSSYIYPASCPSTPFAPLALHMAHRHHAQPTMPQLNGSSASIPPSAVVSPVAGPSSQNGTTQSTIIQRLNAANEETWLLIGVSLFFPIYITLCISSLSSSFLTCFPGRVAEQMGNLEEALSAYENALRHNPLSLNGLTQVAGIARIKENYPKVNITLLPPLPMKSRPSKMLFPIRQSTTFSAFSTSRRRTARYGLPSVSPRLL
jgi:hypothetical protein